jgi:adenine-specific DNA-methyltransferase
LTYENPVAIGHNRAFQRVAPLLWLRAGAEGRCIDAVPESGWDVAGTYGILFDLDQAAAYVRAIEKSEHIVVAYVVTDDDRRFQAVARHLPEGVEVVRLYESYLSNFRFTGVEP